MTCLEKLKNKKPALVGEKYIGGAFGCPVMFGYGDPACPGVSDENCKTCWKSKAVDNTMINFIRTHTDEEVFEYLERNMFNNDAISFLKTEIISDQEPLECPYEPGDIVWVIDDNNEIRREKVRSLCFFENDYGISTYTGLNFMRSDFDKYILPTKEAAVARQKENASNGTK